MRQWKRLIMLVAISVPLQAIAGVLTLDQTIVNVLEGNPALKAAGYESRAAAELIRAEKMSPAFKTSIELENFGGNGIYESTDNMESTLRLSKVLEIGDKAEHRSKVASNKALMIRNEQDATRLDTLAEATRRFIHIVTDQLRLDIAQQSESIAKRTRNSVKRRVDAGKSHAAELSRANIEVARKSIELEHAEHELANSRVKLAILWGEEEARFENAEADLFAIDPIGSFDSLVALLEYNPELMRFATQERLNQSRLLLAKSSASPDIELSGGLRHLNTTDDTGLVFSLNIPLGTSSRAAPRSRSIENMQQREPYLYQQRKLELHATLFEVYQEIHHAIEAVATLREIIIPQAESALKAYEKGYNAGRFSLLELSEAQNTLIESRLEAVMAAADYHRFLIEIDRLTGAATTNTKLATSTTDNVIQNKAQDNTTRGKH